MCIYCTEKVGVSFVPTKISLVYSSVSNVRSLSILYISYKLPIFVKYLKKKGFL